MKRKMINELYSGRNRQIAAWIGITIYIVLCSVSMLYPMAWYIYIWIYRTVLSAEQSLIVEADTFSAQNLFIWIIGGFYCFLLIIGLIAVINHVCTGVMRTTITKLKAVVFVWITGYFLFYQVSAAKNMLQKLPIVGIVLESETLEFNVALIVLNYLYGDQQPKELRDSISMLKTYNADPTLFEMDPSPPHSLIGLGSSQHI